MERIQMPNMRTVPSKMETLLVTRQQIDAWKAPPFQRPLRVNEKVKALAKKLETDGGIVPGTITIGTITGDPTTWVVDGQHRIESFKISDLTECIIDVRVCEFENMADMANEFVQLNSSLVKMGPDDMLRGLEGTIKSLSMIIEQCPFVGYGRVQRGSFVGPVLSMATVLRTWAGSAPEVPTSGGNSATNIAQEMEVGDTNRLIAFLQTAHAAWGRDPEYYRLWSNLNMTITMWMYRRLVLMHERGIKRFVRLSNEEFKACLMAVSADSNYLDWLVGRQLNDKNRNPCYSRLRALFAERIQIEHNTEKKPMFPQPSWAS
jgi:hypothetical protein